MWYGPFIISKVLEKGASELVDYDGIPLGQVICPYLSWTVSCIYVYYLNFCVLKYFQYGFEFSVCICLYNVLVVQSRWLSMASLMVLAATP